MKSYGKLLSLILMISLNFPVFLHAEGLKLLTPAKVVFKNILAGDTLHYQVKLVNQGKDQIKIYRVISSCKCTVPSFKPTSIEPEDTLEIPVLIDTEGFWGTTLRTIQILSNDPDQPKNTVLFEIHVKNELEFQPRFIDLQDVVVGQAVNQQIAVWNNSENDITIEEIETDEKRMKIDWQKSVLHPGDTATFNIQFKPENSFSSYAIIYIHTIGTRNPLFKIPVYINVKENDQ